jgi:hypothetical protein
MPAGKEWEMAWRRSGRDREAFLVFYGRHAPVLFWLAHAGDVEACCGR